MNRRRPRRTTRPALSATPRNTPQIRQPAPTRYVVLDLMRGLAALAVLVFHMNYMLGTTSHVITKGYLAVDFFFVLSGFVIAANYHVSVRPTISWTDFLSARIARLWPLFILTALIGCVAITMKATRDFGYFDAQNVAATLALNSVMIPSFLKIYGVDRLFFFNAASWSVFFELVVNLVFFAGLRRLSLKPMLALTVGFAVVLAFVAQNNGSLDGGWALETFHVGSARILFGFTAGMAIYLASLRTSFHTGIPATVTALAGLCLSFFVVGDWMSDYFLVTALFPLLVLVGSQGRLGKGPARIGGRLGDISYSVYLLQTPAMLFVSWACKMIVGRKIAEFAPYSGALFVLALLGVSYLSWRYFELPARNYLRHRIASLVKPENPVTEGAA